MPCAIIFVVKIQKLSIRKSPLLYLLASLTIYFLLLIGVPKARFLAALADCINSALKGANPPLTVVLTISGIAVLSIPTIAFMTAQVSVVYQFAKLRFSFRAALLALTGLLLALSATVAIMIWRLDVVAKLHRLPTWREIGFIVGLYKPGLLKMALHAIIMLVAANIGCLVSLRIKDRNLLLPVVMFAATIDFWTVMVGPVSVMMEHAPEIVQAASTPIPHAGTGQFVPALMMGMGDPLFMAVVFASVHRLGMNGRRNYFFVLCIMTLAMLAVLLNFAPYLPALVALAVAVIAANWGEFKLNRQEKISTAIVAVMLVVLLLLASRLIHQKAPIAKPPSDISTPQKNPL